MFFSLVDDFAEDIRLTHTIPSGPSIEYPLSKEAGTPTVEITGGCKPVSKGDVEVTRICNMYWGKKQIIKDVRFDFE